MNLIGDYSLTTGFFGKLPKFADFVKVNASGNEIVILDNWIQEGLAAAKLKFKNEWKNFYEASGNLNFIFPFTGTDKVVLGVIKPSHDKSGRQFPFLFFVNINRNVLNCVPVHLIAMKYKNIFNVFNDLVQNNFESESLDNFKSAEQNFYFPSGDENLYTDLYQKYISAQTTYNFFGLPDDQKKLDEMLNYNLSYFENSAGINFTFSSDTENEFLNLSFVIDMLINISSIYSLMPALFWKRLSENNFVLNVFFQKPSPLNFVDLIHSEKIISRIQDSNSSRNSNKIFKGSPTINLDESLDKFLSLVKTSLKQN